MKRNIKRGAAAVGIVTILTGSSYGIALGWNLLKTQALGEQGAATNTALENINKHLDSIDRSQSDQAKDISNLQTDLAVTKALVTAGSPALGVNAPKVEKETIKQIVASSTNESQ